MKKHTATEKTATKTVKFSISESGSFAAEYYIHKSEETEERKNYPVHLHDRTEIYVLLSGTSSFVSGDKAYALAPYDAVIVPPGKLHHCLLDKDTVHSHACFWFETKNDCFDGIFKNKDFPELVRFRGNMQEEAKSVLDYFYNFQQRSKPTDISAEKFTPGEEIFGKLKTYSFFLRFLSVLSESANASAADNKKIEEKPAEVPPILLRVLSDVNQNFASISTADELSKRHFVSFSTLGRLFSKYLSVSPKAYLEAKKLAASVIYLKNGESVSEAAVKAGFCDCSNYIRLFKLRFGVTPKRFAERYQKN